MYGPVDKPFTQPNYRNQGIDALSTQQLEFIYQAAVEAGTSDDFLELIQWTIRKREKITS
jgi:hypothetical protein